MRKTYPQLHDHPLHLVAEHPAISIPHVGNGGVVLKRGGNLNSLANQNVAREVLLAQKTKDVVDLAFMRTPRDYFPRPAKMIKINVSINCKLKYMK